MYLIISEEKVRLGKSLWKLCQEYWKLIVNPAPEPDSIKNFQLMIRKLTGKEAFFGQFNSFICN